ncbi:MAG: IspD/TarI family cytidylyltransferase [Candidatus Limnocylindrales bacterium]
MRIHALLLAGGYGNRFGAEVPKQFIRLAGEPILLRSARTVAAAGVDRLVVVAHQDWIAESTALLEAAGLSLTASVVAGGASRNESTRNGLHALAADPDDIVIVHDAVRPLVPVEVIRRAIEPIAAGRADSTDTVIPSADTLVIVDGDRVVEIPDRSRYRRGQTPQVFRASILAEAYRRAAAAGDLRATDDCSLVLRYLPDARVVAVAGDEVNLKITTRIDMVMADRMLQMRTLELDGSDATTDASPGRSLHGARVAGRRRHERHRPGDRRRSAARRREGRDRGPLDWPRRPRRGGGDRARGRRGPPTSAAWITSCARPVSCGSGPWRTARPPNWPRSST